MINTGGGLRLATGLFGVLALEAAMADIDQGLYLGIGVQEVEVDQEQIEGSETTLNGTLGYRFNRFMATEFGAYSLGDFSESAVVGGAIGEAEYSGWALGIALVPRLPIWKFDLYARGGVAYYDVRSRLVTSVGGAKDDETGFNVYGGLGGSFNVGPRWSVFIEYTRMYAVERVDMAGIGARFHF